jgi:murein DD-endopeptidase MepM/ murein hydrolase activator NlpD
VSTDLSAMVQGPVASTSASADGGARPEADRARIAEAAKQFEAMFLLQMLKQMRQSMLADESEEPGLGAGTMFDTIDAELSKKLAGQSGGLTPMLLEAMSKAGAGLGTAAGGSVTAAPMMLATPGAAPAIPLVPAALPLKTEHVKPIGSGTDDPPGEVTSGFGWRKDPFTGTSRFHAGVDIRASYGRDVGSVAAGRVVSAGVQGGYGQSVVVEHAPGLRTRYAHLSSIDVEEGQAIESGAVLGKVGQSGRATGPHLHFEVLKNGQAVNPAAGGRLLAAALKETPGGADYPTGSAGLRAALLGAEE